MRYSKLSVESRKFFIPHVIWLPLGRPPEFHRYFGLKKADYHTAYHVVCLMICLAVLACYRPTDRTVL